MIGMLKGTVWQIDDEKVILDVNGVGYVLNVPSGSLIRLREGEDKVFYTHLQVREDDLSLYGFSNLEEKNLFTLLLGVSGIGPKAALAILSVYPPQQVKAAIIREDVAQLTQVPGIGGKTAKRLILELKEKIKDAVLEYGEAEMAPAAASSAGEAFDTLLVLGFSRIEARDALNRIKNIDEYTIEEQVREALKHLAVRNRT